jgi:integrase
VWSSATLRRFLEVTADDELFPLWFFLATTGTRRGEALGLRWNDTDLDTKKVKIIQTVMAIGWEIHYGQPKTAAGRPAIVLDPGTVEVLRTHRKKMLEKRILVGPSFVDRDLVFCQPDGSPHHPERVYEAFKRAIKKHGLPDLPIHGLRHTWATLALEAGIHPKVVSERLGHSNIAITLDMYSHSIPSMHEAAPSAVANLIRG